MANINSANDDSWFGDTILGNFQEIRSQPLVERTDACTIGKLHCSLVLCFLYVAEL